MDDKRLPFENAILEHDCGTMIIAKLIGCAEIRTWMIMPQPATRHGQTCCPILAQAWKGKGFHTQRKAAC